ncbi:MAG: hypothetical protein AAFR70_14455, partial [Pseudomonadota bacterium]
SWKRRVIPTFFAITPVRIVFTPYRGTQGTIPKVRANPNFMLRPVRADAALPFFKEQLGKTEDAARACSAVSRCRAEFENPAGPSDPNFQAV